MSELICQHFEVPDIEECEYCPAHRDCPVKRANRIAAPMTTPNDASASAAENERLQQIREQYNAASNDIKKYTWDEYCDLAHALVPLQSARIDALEADNASLRTQLAAATGALDAFASTWRTYLKDTGGKTAFSEWWLSHNDWWSVRRACEKAQAVVAATPPAGAEEDGR